MRLESMETFIRLQQPKIEWALSKMNYLVG